MKPLRVLHIVTKMNANGLETLIMNIYRNIDRNKVQFDFLVHREDEGFYDNEILKLGGKIFSVPSINPFHHKKYIRALDAFFKEYKEYKIVHSHLNTYSMWPLRAAKKAGIPIRISHSHISNVPLDYKSLFRFYTKSKLLNFTTHNFACSSLAGEWLFGKNEEFKVINNSIDSEKYTFDEKSRIRMRKELNVEGNFVIGHIGRFNKQKNHSFILKVFQRVLIEKPNSILVLVGEGDLKPTIMKKSQELGIYNNIIFTGVRKDIPQLLHAMDLFLFPSIYEGLGIVAVEAQAAGLPTIVSEEIPKEAFLTNLIQKVDLNTSVDTWADKILEFSYGYDRKDTSQEIMANDYDIKSTADWLEKFYLNVV